MKRLVSTLFAMAFLTATSACAFQASISVPNGTGAQVRSATNNAFQAVATHQSGPAAPSIAYPYEFWVDTSSTPATVKMRNGANSAWIAVGTLNDAGSVFAASNATNATNADTVDTFHASKNPVTNQIPVVGDDWKLNIPVLNNTGFDLMLGSGDQVTRGNSGQSRAFVKGDGSVLHINYAGDFTGGTIIGSGNLVPNGTTIWHSGNDGAGSGLDADTVQGWAPSSRMPSGWMPAFRGVVTLIPSGSLSIPNNTTTPVALTADYADTENVHDTFVNPSRIAIPTGVTGAKVTATVRFAANATGTRLVTVSAVGSGGATIATAQSAPGVSGQDTYITCPAHFYQLQSGTGYIEVTAFQNSGVALNVIPNTAVTVEWLY